MLRSNPTAGVRLRGAAEPVDAEPAAKALTDAELAALLAAVPARWRLLVWLLADTGLRIGEALALQWQHVDFGRRRVLVRRRHANRPDVARGVHATCRRTSARICRG